MTYPINDIRECAELHAMRALELVDALEGDELFDAMVAIFTKAAVEADMGYYRLPEDCDGDRFTEILDEAERLASAPTEAA